MGGNPLTPTATPGALWVPPGPVRRERGYRSPSPAAVGRVPSGRRGRGVRASAGRGGQGVRPFLLIAVSGALLVLLAGCAMSPEAARVRGEPGADPGNHGDPVELLAPPSEFTRVYADVPYIGPSVATEDTSQS
jgi:hypothetical protein